MNFNSLSSNEKLAVYGAIAAIVGVLIASFLAGIGWIALLAGIAMLVVVFLPQLSAGTALPGSKGSLMFLIGLIAGVAAVLMLLFTVTSGGFGAYFQFYAINTIFMLIGVAGGLVMAWAGWQEFQAEGGTFNVGTTGTSSSAARTSTPAGTAATTGSTSADTTGMGSAGPASTSVGSTSAGSTDMGSEGGALRRDDDEGTLRNP